MSRLTCACVALLLSTSLPVLAQDQPQPPAPAAVEQSAPAPAPVEIQPPAPVADSGAEAERSLLPHDLSPWGMFVGADIVVKAVMVGLAFASLLTWTIALAKSLELLSAGRRARAALREIVRARSLDEAASVEARRSDSAAMVTAARQEIHFSAAALDHVETDGVKERVASHLARIEAAAGRRMMRGTGLLATIGSTAPFVGLFGTVWGIMNSFIGISEAQTTNLAIVAPGIAEALLATAIGLVAAIPAVVIYNMFARAITGYRQLLADTSAAIERIVSRDLDFRRAPRLRAAAE